MTTTHPAEPGLHGAGQIVDADGTSHELAGDSILILPFGWSGYWHVRTPLRTFDVFSPRRLAVSDE
jgi:uncharacterized cupin superfamily protein